MDNRENKPYPKSRRLSYYSPVVLDPGVFKWHINRVYSVMWDGKNKVMHLVPPTDCVTGHKRFAGHERFAGDRGSV